MPPKLRLKIETDNKFETLLEISDTCEDIVNDSNIAPAEPKPQPIFMKLTENFYEIISSLENSLNTTLKKKVTGDLIQIYPAHVIQYRHIQKYLADNSIEFYAVQPRKERPKNILLKGIPKSFPITKLKSELERLNFDIHRVSQLRNFRTKEPYPCFLVGSLGIYRQGITKIYTISNSFMAMS